jgi:F-type H+-transporting ATPase subunit b
MYTLKGYEKCALETSARVTLFCSIVLSTGLALASGAGADDALISQPMNQLISLATFIFIIVYFSGKSIKEGLKTRAEEISREVGEAQKLYQAAEETLTKYQAMVDQFESERDAMIAQYKTQGEAEKAKLIEEGHREAERVTADADRAIENELTLMQHKIERELVEASLKKAEALLNEKVNLQDHDRLNKDYLKQVEDIHGDA